MPFKPLQVQDFQHLYKVLTEALLEYNETNAGGWQASSGCRCCTI